MCHANQRSTATMKEWLWHVIDLVLFVHALCLGSRQHKVDSEETLDNTVCHHGCEKYKTNGQLVPIHGHRQSQDSLLLELVCNSIPTWQTAYAKDNTEAPK